MIPPAPPGQARALATLRTLADGSARTLLFAGPGGVGQLQAARWWAALLCCEARLDDPCGRCRSCLRWREADAGLLSLEDYRELAAPATTKDGRTARRHEITIGQLVERDRGDPDPLGPWLRSPPTHRVRVAVIDGADTLNDSAANAFLKMLEEPPEHARIILVASGPDALLPTVASRCTVVRFRPVQVDADTWRQLGPHPAVRLGRPGTLGDAASEAAARDAVDAFVTSLAGTLAQTFVTLPALQQAWDLDEDRVVGLLLERARAVDAAAYLACDDALERARTAVAAYAHRGLAFKRLALALRLRWSATPAAR